jgi:hypothetical protein
MKKINFIVVALFVAASLFAQEDEKNTWWGIKGGSNFASQRVGKGMTDWRIGFHTGSFIEKKISNSIGLQLELLYSMQGANYKAGSKNCIDKLDYINAPLMFKFYVIESRRLSIDIGPQFGYVVNAKYKESGKTTNAYSNDRLKKFDVSLGLGVSYKIKDRFDLVLRGTEGLTKIDKKQKNKNSVGQLGIGYRF